jgi:ferrous iron transport protein B
MMRIALAGNPNAGKSSVFNRLTGLQQKVGNFPGVTVDKKTGPMQLPGGGKAELIDLPGVYSLYPHSPDQVVTLEVLLNRQDPLHPDVVLYIADAGNLERHLLLFSEIADLGLPLVLCLNQTDLAEASGIHADPDRLSRALGVPVFAINGRTGEGLSEALRCVESSGALQPARAFWAGAEQAPDFARAAQGVLPGLSAYQACLVAHHYRILPHLDTEQKNRLSSALQPLGFLPLREQVDETLARFDRIQHLLAGALDRSGSGRASWSHRLDRVLTHPLWGTALFFAVLLLIFQAMFSWAQWPMNTLDAAMTSLRQVLDAALPPGVLSAMLIDGLLPGIGGVLIFVPQITILFFLVALMEETGYMARAVYLADNIMRRFGLNGRSFVALISGVACAVPAVMTARGITNRQERMSTIFVTPFMSCSARLPVFALLIAFAVPARPLLGNWINTQGLAMFVLYLLGAGAALGSAWLLKLLFKSREPSYLMLELPAYQSPHWRNVYTTVWNKVSVFVLDAGRIIVVIALVLWALSSYGPGKAMQEARLQAKSYASEQGLAEQETQDLIAARSLQASWAGQLGQALEPVIAPLGFDWKIGIALITSFAAREVFVATMATIYGAGSPDNQQGILESMRRDVHSDSGKPVYTAATAISLLLFYVFAMQCMSTLAVVKRETGGWRLPVYQFLYMTGLAYAASLIAYQVLR